MQPATSKSLVGWGGAAQRASRQSTVAEHLLHIVDAGLCGIIILAPYVFGGRHDMGRLVLVSLISITTAAWFVRQSILPVAQWPRTAAHAVVLLAAAFLIFQVVPLPPAVVATLAPRNAELLPLWTTAADQATLGTWQTLSLNPHETTKALAMLASYGLLFVVVTGRIQHASDIRRILKMVAVSAVLMAIFGVLQYFTSDGRFFWFYRHPFRSAAQNFCGSFTNRNHFANFLVLGIGPLVCWLLRPVEGSPIGSMRHKSIESASKRLLSWGIAGATAFVAAAALASRSRGGAIALLSVSVVLAAIYVSRRVLDRRALFGVVGLAVAVVALLSLHGYDQVVDRLDTIADGSMEELDHGGVRQKLWAANVESIKAGWLTGAGAGTHGDVCPVYLRESFNREYIHADNGYLEIATETGIIGALLLTAAVALCGAWGLTCFRNLSQRDEILLFGALAAGLVATLVHSVVDFVWYVPACMSTTIVLASCLMRLAELSRPTNDGLHTGPVLKRARWVELSAATVLVGGWSIHTFVGPAGAAIYWDRYLRASVEDSKIAHESFNRWVGGEARLPTAARRALSQQMLRELVSAIEWDPKLARAHRRLADRYMAEFELRAGESANAMNVAQIRDAAQASSFTSVADLHRWLSCAFGPDVELLEQALAHARRATELCPLAGDGYVYLAELSFLNNDAQFGIEACIDQGLRVRPYDRNVLLAAGQRALIEGRRDLAIEYWSRCFNTPGSHQKKITYHLAASGMPAAEFIHYLKPDWQTLRDIWAKYRQFGSQPDLDALLSYSLDRTRQETADSRGIRRASIWFWQAGLYADANRNDESLRCLQQANACDSRQFFIRRALAQALKAAGRMAEAEPHYRWCLARRPEDKNLSNSLAEISRSRIAKRQSTAGSLRPTQPTQ
jgi:O-antigen ligase